jgi:hypothetical protein
LRRVRTMSEHDDSPDHVGKDDDMDDVNKGSMTGLLASLDAIDFDRNEVMRGIQDEANVAPPAIRTRQTTALHEV